MTSAAQPSRADDTRSDVAPTPWWRVRMVWLVVGGPAAVVVASLVTAVVAYRGADTIVSDAPAGRQVVRPTAETPAMQARNHAATAESR